jgi:hypothetical protein
MELRRDADAVKNATFAQGRIRFLQAIKQASEAGFVIEQLDSMQDLAVLFLHARYYKEAQQYLDQIRQTVDTVYPGHTIISGQGLVELDDATRVDACYKLVGQVELLEGMLVFERGKEEALAIDPSAKLPKKPDLITAAERFLLAVSYFDRYAGEDYARRQSYRHIYRRFKDYDPYLIQEIVDDFLPEWIQRYDLPVELVRSYFVDVFGMPGRLAKRH